MGKLHFSLFLYFYCSSPYVKFCNIHCRNSNSWMECSCQEVRPKGVSTLRLSSRFLRYMHGCLKPLSLLSPSSLCRQWKKWNLQWWELHMLYAECSSEEWCWRPFPFACHLLRFWAVSHDCCQGKLSKDLLLIHHTHALTLEEFRCLFCFEISGYGQMFLA